MRCTYSEQECSIFCLHSVVLATQVWPRAPMNSIVHKAVWIVRLVTQAWQDVKVTDRTQHLDTTGVFRVDVETWNQETYRKKPCKGYADWQWKLAESILSCLDLLFLIVVNPCHKQLSYPWQMNERAEVHNTFHDSEADGLVQARAMF